MSKARDEVLADRQRQMDQEGYDRTHDAEHDPEELIRAALVYTLTSLAHPDANGHVSVGMECRGVKLNWMESATALWPWDGGPKPKTQRRDLVRAAALLIAALDRLED